MYIVDQDIVALLDESGELVFYSLELGKVLELQQIDPQTECVQSTSRGLQRPCECCKPSVYSGNGYISVAWHNLTFILSTKAGEHPGQSTSEDGNEIVDAL